MQALADIQTAASFSSDEIIDLSKQRGQLPRNKTGDIMVAIEGKDDCSIGLEVKLDKGVKLGLLDNRDPAAQTDTAIGQLLEMRVYKVDYVRTTRKKSIRTNTHKLINKAVANIQAVEKGTFGVGHI